MVCSVLLRRSRELDIAVQLRYAKRASGGTAARSELDLRICLLLY